MSPPLQGRPRSSVPASPTAASPASESFQSNKVSYFDAVIGGGYDFGTSFRSPSAARSEAAPQYAGGTFLLQPSVCLFWNQDFDFRLGGDLRYSVLNPGGSASHAATSLGTLFLGGLGEANFYPHAMLGVGFNLSLGYLGLMANQLEVSNGSVGRLDWASSGNLGFGTQFYLSTFFATGRLGVSLEKMFGGFAAAGSDHSSIDLNYGPALTLFAALDPVRFVSIFAHMASL